MSLVIVSTCMNRNEFLLKSLPSWVALGVPIVLVDWSSDVPLRAVLGRYRDFVTLVEVRDQLHYNNSRAKNLGFRAAYHFFPKASHLLHLDCDVIIRDPEYFPREAARPEESLHRGWKLFPGWGVSKAVRWASLLLGATEFVNHGLFGTFMVSRSLLERVNGYDERMTGYGIFDTDLYTRIARLGGIREIRIPRAALYHQPHGGRSDNYAEKKRRASERRNLALSRDPWGTHFPSGRQECRIEGEPFLL